MPWASTTDRVGTPVLLLRGVSRSKIFLPRRSKFRTGVVSSLTLGGRATIFLRHRDPFSGRSGGRSGGKRDGTKDRGAAIGGDRRPLMLLRHMDRLCVRASGVGISGAVRGR